MAMRGLLVALLLLTVSPQSQPRLPAHVESLQYPTLARQARIAGDVTLTGQVDLDGRPGFLALTAGPLLVSPLLEQAAIDNIRTWRFEPGPRSELKVTYHFALEGDESHDSQSVTRFDFPDSVTIVVHPPITYIDTSTLGKSKKK
jgi:TonB family protein